MHNEPKLGLMENAYDFLNESLRNASLADDDPRKWKFAVINAAQAIELLLKERLRREHSLLVYTQVDKPRHTVAIDLALQRLESCGVELDEEDIARVRRAKDIRNNLIHFSSNLTWQQLEHSYIDLFELLTHSTKRNSVGSCTRRLRKTSGRSKHHSWSDFAANLSHTKAERSLSGSQRRLFLLSSFHTLATSQNVTIAFHTGTRWSDFLRSTLFRKIVPTVTC